MQIKKQKKFLPRLMIMFCSAGKVSCCLVSSKLYPFKRVTGSCKCNGKSCVV